MSGVGPAPHLVPLESLSPVELVNLGRTGLKVSRICLGCMTYGSPKWRPWVLDEEASRPFYRAAWESGINFFDTADMYSDGASEEVLGRALRDLAIPREEVVVATKVFNPMGPTLPTERGLSSKHIRHAIDASLKRLQLDHVDLYQIHRFDPSTPIEETMEALDAVVRSGKALHIGASSMYRLADGEDAPHVRSARPGPVRDHAEPLQPGLPRGGAGDEPALPGRGGRADPLEPAGPRFPGRQPEPREDRGETSRAKTDDFAHKLYYDEGDFAVVDRVGEIAAKRGVSNARVALAWLLHQPGVTAPIVGASKSHHLEDAIAAPDLKLDEAELKALAEPYRPHPILGHS